MKRKIFLTAGVLLVVLLCVHIYQFNLARQARFSVAVLQRYAAAYRIMTGKRVRAWSDLPDFHIISSADSLSLKSADLKRSPVRMGYIYDLDYLGGDRFVISASPIGFLAPKVEYGTTERGDLRENSANPDPSADPYAEVLSWPPLDQREQIRSADLPSYLQD